MINFRVHIKWAFVLATIILSLTLTSCSEDSNQKKLGEAQACLDKAGDNPTAAALCANHLSGASGPKIDAMLCSIKFVAGGINTSRLVEAVQQINDGSNKEEVFASMLVFNGLPGATKEQALINVQAAAANCNASGVKGLIFLSQFSVIGTVLMATLIGVDTAFWTNPTPSSATLGGGGLTATLTACQQPNAATCDQAAAGAAIITLNQSYCAGKEDDPTCQDVAAAVAAGATPEEVAANFFATIGND